MPRVPNLANQRPTWKLAPRILEVVRTDKTFTKGVIPMKILNEAIHVNNGNVSWNSPLNKYKKYPSYNQVGTTTKS
jgi:hypothetical protein